jgi:L-serine dehydratase
MARAILGDAPDHARILLHGSFAATGEGHGTHRAIVGGLVGLLPDDLRLRRAYEEAQAGGLTWEFVDTDLGEDAHPNTARFELSSGTERAIMVGASIGGGRIEVTEIDGFHVALGGDYHTLVVLARDEPGTIMAITGLFAAQRINLATMRVDRTGRNREALMTLEADAPIPDAVLDELRCFAWIHWARRVARVA